MLPTVNPAIQANAKQGARPILGLNLNEPVPVSASQQGKCSHLPSQKGVKASPCLELHPHTGAPAALCFLHLPFRASGFWALS